MTPSYLPYSKLVFCCFLYHQCAADFECVLTATFWISLYVKWAVGGKCLPTVGAHETRWERSALFSQQSRLYADPALMFSQPGCTEKEREALTLKWSVHTHTHTWWKINANNCLFLPTCSGIRRRLQPDAVKAGKSNYSCTWWNENHVARTNTRSHSHTTENFIVW